MSVENNLLLKEDCLCVEMLACTQSELFSAKPDVLPPPPPFNLGSASL